MAALAAVMPTKEAMQQEGCDPPEGAANQQLDKTITMDGRRTKR
jgi:hypothetical protein